MANPVRKACSRIRKAHRPDVVPAGRQKVETVGCPFDGPVGYRYVHVRRLLVTITIGCYPTGVPPMPDPWGLFPMMDCRLSRGIFGTRQNNCRDQPLIWFTVEKTSGKILPESAFARLCTCMARFASPRSFWPHERTGRQRIRGKRAVF